MHAVVRMYSGQGASEVFDLVARSNPELKELFGSIAGFVSYTAVRNGDGGMTLTVCEDEAGTAESSRRAAGFIKERLTEPVKPTQIIEGSTVLQFTAAERMPTAV